MLNVGLSPSLKDTIGKTMLLNADTFSSPNGKAPGGAQSSFALKVGQRTAGKHELPMIMMSPQSGFDAHMRNRNSVSMVAKTADENQVTADQRKLLKQLKEDKLLRQKREEERR